MLNWPLSIFEWDVLFLIPLPWIGPVLAPCIVSATMILFAAILLYYEWKSLHVRIKKPDWIILIGISLLYIFSFTSEQLDVVGKAHNNMIDLAHVFVPQTYQWRLFLIPFFLFMIWLFSFVKRNNYIVAKLK